MRGLKNWIFSNTFVVVMVAALLAPISSLSNAEAAESTHVRILSKLPHFELTNQNNEKVDSEDLYGKLWIANFIFTECKGICPAQTASMNQLQSTFKKTPSAWKDIRLVSISVDPDHDTPDALKRYIADKDLEASQWHFLTGGREEIWDLTKQGFKLPVAEDAKNKAMPILHSSQFVLVDWEGRIRGYYNGLDPDAVKELMRDTGTVFRERTPYPADVLSPSWVQPRMQQQIQAVEKADIFTDFAFTDEVTKSEIGFRHQIIDDISVNYKAVHYDHGNAIAVADVDLDGHNDIYFTTMIGSNELWRNKGDGTFENITKESGLFIDDRIGVAASFADIDNDGDPDLYITSVRLGNMLFENDGKGKFKDISKRSRTDIRAHSSGAVFFDYNNDGLLDLFVNNVGVYTTDEVASATVYTTQGQRKTDYEYYVGFKDAFAGHLKPERTETSVLFKNLGNNRFEDVSKKTNLVDTSWSGEAAVVDGNNDGWPDLYVLNMQGHDEYYENNEGKTFTRKSRDVFRKTPWGAMGVVPLDFDNDGDLDIYITDMHSDMSELVTDPKKEKLKSNMQYPESFLKSGGNSLFGNAFYRNDGNEKYTEVSDQIGAENYWPWGPSSGDLNADGYEDLFVASSMNYPFQYSVNSVLLNDNGKGFIDSEYALGVEPRKFGRTAAPWFELNCAGKDAGHLNCGDNSRDRKVVWGALGTRSSVIFDLDQDGDQDIVTLELNQPPMVLLSNLSEKKKLNYLNVSLSGTKSNRGGIGATIKVYAGKNVYTKVNNGKSGYLSQSLYPVYFGLGENNSVEKIEVSWPSGQKQVVSENITLNDLITIKEPK